MKKLLLAFLLFTLSITFYLPKINAYTVQEYDLTDEWDYIATDIPAMTYLTLQGDFGLGTQEFEFITAPMANVELQITDTGIDYYSYVIITFADDTTETILLEDLFGVGESIITFNNSAFAITFNRTAREISASGVGGVHYVEDNFYNVDFRNAVSFTFKLLIDDNGTWDYEDMVSFKENSSSLLTSGRVAFNYWVLGELYFTSYEYTIPEEAPAEPDEPEDYEFIGWKTTTGDYIVFNGDTHINDDWIDENTGTVNLFARFESETEGYLGGEPTPAPPSFLSQFLGLFNMAEDSGYMLFFTILLIVFVVGVSLLNAPAILDIIALIIYVALYLIYGMLPVYYIIGFFAIVLLIFITVIKKSRIEENEG